MYLNGTKRMHCCFPIAKEFTRTCHVTLCVRSQPCLFRKSLNNTSSSSVTSQALIDLFRPRLMVSSSVFPVVFVHFVYNSALFLSSCCCSFLLYVVANLICIFLVFRQLAYFHLFHNFVVSFVVKRVYPVVVLKNFVSIDVLVS